MFLNNNYAVMRHAYESNSNISLNEEQICRKVIDLVAEKIAGKTVRVFHSHIRRARLTAEIVRSELVAQGFQVAEPVGLEWLSHDVRNENIATVLPDNSDEFCIFVSHQPELEEYLYGFFYHVDNCNVFSEDFVVTRNDVINR